MRAAEAIVGRAWAEELLHHYDRTDRAVNAAREQYEAACLRLFAAQRCGDPGEISVAHAALERAVDACRTGVAAREQGRQALQTALDALARMGVQQAVSATADQVQGAGPVPTTAPAPTPGLAIRTRSPDGDASRAAWRVFWWLGRRSAHRALDPGPP